MFQEEKGGFMLSDKNMGYVNATRRVLSAQKLAGNLNYEEQGDTLSDCKQMT